jgi:asparagine synthase (glutamine-hydrolysing)
MCGIAGLAGYGQNSEALAENGSAMISALVHRGPDDDGLWTDEKFGLAMGHRRLSIQDLSEHGAQPMLSPSGQYLIVFNGEIYNFKEIAADLRQRGYSFNGHSDTEVLLAAIEEWGTSAAIARFIGMFAFALWDSKDKKLFLCRDRLGEKPLYYGWLGNSFYFASELKAIEKVVPKQLLAIDYDGLSSFLSYGYVSAPFSIYQGIYKLPPGSMLTLEAPAECDDWQPPPGFSPYADNAVASPVAYWSVMQSANSGLKNMSKDEDEAVSTLDEMLHRTIKRQMIADVSIGTFLSGGIDSSVVSAIAQHESERAIKTYTIGFSEKEYDESAYAEAIARHLGTDHLTMRVTPGDALGVVPELHAIYDEPFADSSQIPTYLVSKLAKQHVTVCLSGDGGDELFAGYNRYLWTESLWKKLAMFPLPLRLLTGKLLLLPSPAHWDAFYSILSGLNKGSQQKLIGLKVQKLAGMMQSESIEQAYDYLMSYWGNANHMIKLDGTAATSQKKALEKLATSDFINQAMFIDQNVYLPGDNLAKVDRASMAVSLETRLPILSHEIVDLSWRIPLQMKVKNNVSKWPLRQVLYKYVPQELIDRPKMGFSVPVASWLRGELKEWAEELLTTLDSGWGHVLDKRPILRAWQEHQSERYDHSHRLWTVLMFLSWARARK